MPISELLQDMGARAVGLLLESGFWILLSLLAGGLIHEFLQTAKVQQAMRRSGHAGVAAGLGLGAMLPICSCGVVPLSLSLYLGGARTAAVMAFTMATPVINPAAVVLSYALLGPQLTLAYVAFGLTAPVVVGYLTERWGRPDRPAVVAQVRSCCCSVPAPATSVAPPPVTSRIWRGFRWGLVELGPMLGFYLAIGIGLASVLGALVPADWIASQLGGASPMSSLFLVALFGASIYVCAVAHIPLVAALMAAGAGPGAAIVFLVTGAATNLPEMFALQRVLGTRTVVVYVTLVVVVSVLAGWGVNLLLDGYQPMIDPLVSLEFGDLATRLTPLVPVWLAVACAWLVALLAVWGTWNWLSRSLSRPTLQPHHG